MAETAELDEYLEAIRSGVCSHCIERPPGGPPCAPLGKRCGIELNLARLVGVVHRVHSTRLTRTSRNSTQKFAYIARCG